LPRYGSNWLHGVRRRSTYCSSSTLIHCEKESRAIGFRLSQQLLPKKNSSEHKCASKGGFLMELEDDDDPALLADELGVSLHTLTSLVGMNMM
jgi:hypothetical protein